MHHDCALDIPRDYEPCADCGFDHEYEWIEAQAWHEKDASESILEVCEECGRDHLFEFDLTQNCNRYVG